MKVISVPSGWRSRSNREIQRDVTELLSGEISVEGIDALKSGSIFGPLREVFPAEVTAWATAFSVNADECVAFRMEKNGVRAEVVLHQTPDGFRIIRCNNVKQMASDLPQS